jgi:hypothetical protein
MQSVVSSISPKDYLSCSSPIQLLTSPSSPTIITTTTPIVAASSKSSPSPPPSLERTYSPPPASATPTQTRKREREEDRSPSASPDENEEEEKLKKRHRRTASEIERNHICKATTCGKAYGSEGALKMHMRLKHPELILSSSSGSLSSPTGSSPTSSPTVITTPNVLEWSQVLASKSPEPSFKNMATPLLHQPTPTVVSSPKSGLIPLWSPFADSTNLVPVDGEDTTSSAIVPQYYVTSPIPLFPEAEEDYYVDFRELKERYSHIPLLRLNIGLWQAESQCPGDLVAKFSYKDRCIIWEIFDVGSLMRTVVSFDELNGVGLELHPDDTATMVIELKNPPTFYKGVLQPYETTSWNPVKDFTAGMATQFRRHILHFSRRALNDPIENIFRRDPHLQSLLLQGLPALKTPYF